MTETNNQQSKNEKQEVPWVKITIAIITVIGIIFSGSGVEWVKLQFQNTPTAITTLTKQVAIITDTPPIPVRPNNPLPQATIIPQFTPGKDWLDGCINSQWILYPPTQIPIEENCYNEPIPGSLFTANKSLIIRAQPDVKSAEEYGIFTKVPQSGTIRMSVDLNLLENAEIWIGIYSEPDVTSDGFLMVVPYYPPANPPGSDTVKRAFAIRHMQMPLENRFYLSPEFEDSDGIYEIGFNLTKGTVAGFMENETTDAMPFSYSDRWLFIGYRALIRRSNIDVSFTNLAIIEK